MEDREVRIREIPKICKSRWWSQRTIRKPHLLNKLAANYNAEREIIYGGSTLNPNEDSGNLPVNLTILQMQYMNE